MHKQLNIPIIDAHAHIMSTERIYSGMRWLKKNVPEAETDFNLNKDKAWKILLDAGVDYYFNFFFPLREGTTGETNQWNLELSLCDPRCIPFVSLSPADNNKLDILERALFKNNFLGLKLHPYVQKFSATDSRLDEVYSYMQKVKRPVIVHTGHEDIYRVPSNKQEIEQLIRKYPEMLLVVPHLCYPDLENAFRLLREYPHIYLDCTNVLWYLKIKPPEKINWDKFEQNTGRILFGTDFSLGMAFPERLYNQFLEIPLSGKAKEDLLYRTAYSLVNSCGRDLPLPPFAIQLDK